MEIVLYPRVQRLAKKLIGDELTARGKSMPIGTKDPDELPQNWIRLWSEGGVPELHEWRPMVQILVCGMDETVVEENANLVHAIVNAAAGVGILVPEYAGAYPWIRQAQHISGPSPIEDEDLPQVTMSRIVVQWHVLPIP